MKILIALAACFLACTTQLLAQNTSKSQKVPVKWTVGTEKTVTQTDSTIIYKNGAVQFAVGSSASYQMKIVNLHDTVYEVLFKQINVDAKVLKQAELPEMSATEAFAKLFVAGFKEKYLGFEYAFLVNKNTGTAFEVKDKEKIGKLIREVSSKTLNEYIIASQKSTNDTLLKKVEELIDKQLEENQEGIMNTMLNSFNYIFQAYSFPYIKDQTYRMKSEVANLDELNHGNKETGADILTTVSMINGLLNMVCEYEYDKEKAYQDYVVSRGRVEKVPMEKFNLEERLITNFDLKTSWIVNSTSIVKVEMGEMIISKISRMQIN